MIYIKINNAKEAIAITRKFVFWWSTFSIGNEPMKQENRDSIVKIILWRGFYDNADDKTAGDLFTCYALFLTMVAKNYFQEATHEFDLWFKHFLEIQNPIIIWNKPLELGVTEEVFNEIEKFK